MQDRVVLVPGFAASHLWRRDSWNPFAKKLWLSAFDVAVRGVLHLDADAPTNPIDPNIVTASSALEEVYQPFLAYMALNQIDVDQFAYDWRADVLHNAELLATHLSKYTGSTYNLTIVAHSMGGLVAAKAIQFMPFGLKQRILRVITCGTPWRGSYRAMELLAGTHEIVSQIAYWNSVMYGRARSRYQREASEVAATWPGVYDMMPSAEMLNTYNPNSVHNPLEAHFWALDNPRVKQAQLEAGQVRRPTLGNTWDIIQHYNWYGVGRETPGPLPRMMGERIDYFPRALLGDGAVPQYSAQELPFSNAINRTFDVDHEQFLNDVVVLRAFRELIGF